MKKVIGILWVVIALSVSGKDYTSKLIGDNNGNIYIRENAKELHPLASLTKVMTLLVTFDAIESKRATLEDMVVMSKDARAQGGSAIKTYKGQRLSVEDLIKATAVYSANNAAYALGEYIGGGSVDDFVKMMNNKAVALGLGDDLKYYTPNGLPPSMTGRGEDKGTAIGIYKLTLEAKKHKKYVELASEGNVVVGNYSYPNRNHSLSKEYGIYGLKTGYHSSAGYNIAALGRKGDIDIVEVIFGAKSDKMRTKLTREGVEEFYKRYKYTNLVLKSRSIESVEVGNGKTKELHLYPEKNYTRLIEKNQKIEVKTTLNEEILAPIRKGEKYGEYEVLVDGVEVEKGSLLAMEDIEKASIVDGIRSFLGI